MVWRVISALFIAAVLLLGGCQAPSDTVSGKPDSSMPPSIASTLTIPENWPKGIPSDIPPLPGVIDSSMGSGGRIRLFYSGVSRAAVVAYVSQMENNGFQAQYEIYVQDQPGVTPSAQNNQEFDGVALKKGTYSLRIAVAGNGGATYDLDGLPAEALKNNLPWPESWASIVPRPDGLNYTESRDIEYSSEALRTVGTFTNPGFTDALQAEHKKVVDNYCARLLSMGYRTVEPPESYQINRTAAGARLFTDGQWVIAVSGGDNSNRVVIEAWKYPEQEKAKWPKSIPDWVPVFRAGELNRVLAGGSTINLSFKNARLEDIAQYRDSLSQAGFSVMPDYAGSNTGDRIYMQKDNVAVYVSRVKDEVELQFEVK